MSAPGAPGAWEGYWAGVAREELLAARALLDLSPRVRGVAEQCVHVGPTGPDLDWEGFARQVLVEGMSSGEAVLAGLVAGLATGAPVELEPLTRLGSWTPVVWRVLAAWGTGRPVTRPGSSVGGRW